jgi:hypothetical protein
VDAGNHWTRLDRVAKYWTSRRALQAAGWGSVAFGAISLALSLVPPGDLVMAVVGVLLLGSGIWNVAAPRPGGALLDGASIVMVGLYNIAGSLGAFSPHAAEVMDSFWIKLGVVQIAWGVFVLARQPKQRDAFHEPPSQAELQHLEEMVRAIRIARVRESADMIEFRSLTWRPETWKGHLTGDGAVFVGSGGAVRVAERGRVSIESDRRKPPGRGMNATLTVGDQRLPIRLSPESLQRIERWKSGVTITRNWAA